MAASQKFEVCLHGLVADAVHTRLQERLFGICTSSVAVYDHEISLVPTSSVKQTKKQERPQLQLGDLPMRIRSRIEETANGLLSRRKWQLCVVGQPEPDRKKQATFRSITATDITGDIFEFITALGYSVDFELVKRGMRFIFNNRIHISVVRYFRLEQPFDLSQQRLIDKLADYWLVEMSISGLEAGGDQTAHVAELRGVANLLNGLVELVQVDHSALRYPPK